MKIIFKQRNFENFLHNYQNHGDKSEIESLEFSGYAQYFRRSTAFSEKLRIFMKKGMKILSAQEKHLSVFVVPS